MPTSTETIYGQQVLWAERYGDYEVKVGSYIFDQTKFNIGIMFFLAGEREFEVEGIPIKIPNSVEDVVEFGEMRFRYKEFVDGVIWVLACQGGHRMAQNYEIPLGDMQLTMMDKVVRPHLESALPAENEPLLRRARSLYAQYQNKSENLI